MAHGNTAGGIDATWYERFFHGIALDLWRAAVPPQQTLAEADYLVEQLRLRPGARVLDVPSGGGRHALELARRGCAVRGIDISAEFVAEARAAARAEGLAAEFTVGDMRAVPAAPAFDGVCCMGNSFGYIGREGSAEFVRAVGRALRPGGRFAINSGAIAESILPALEQTTRYDVGDIVMHIANTYHVREGCLETRFAFVRGGTRDERTSYQWVFTLAELGDMLARGGMAIVAAHAATDGAPYALGAQQAYVVAERK
jgi:SAM-dependent methyltransferase